MMHELVKTSRRVWFIVSAAMVTVGAVIVIARAVVRIDAVEVKANATAAEVETLKLYERRTNNRVQKIDVKTDLVMERLNIPIPAHLRAPTEQGDAP